MLNLKEYVLLYKSCVYSGNIQQVSEICSNNIQRVVSSIDDSDDRATNNGQSSILWSLYSTMFCVTNTEVTKQILLKSSLNITSYKYSFYQ